MKRLFATPSRDSERHDGLFEFVLTGRRAPTHTALRCLSSFLRFVEALTPYGVALFEFVLRVVEAPTPTALRYLSSFLWFVEALTPTA